MPKMTDRERLAKLEGDRLKLDMEANQVRAAVRAQYGALTADIAVEQLTEREFKALLSHAIRLGGGAALNALKASSPAGSTTQMSPERRPSDEHGGAARRRPAPLQGAASPGDGAGVQPAP